MPPVRPLKKKKKPQFLLVKVGAGRRAGRMGYSQGQNQKNIFVKGHAFTMIFPNWYYVGPNLLHMEIPRLGVELELPLPAYTIATAMWDLHHSLWQLRSLTHWARSGVEPASSQILVEFISTEPQQEFQHTIFYFTLSIICLLKVIFLHPQYSRISFSFLFLMCLGKHNAISLLTVISIGLVLLF